MLYFIAKKIVTGFAVGFGLLSAALSMGISYGFWHTEPRKALAGGKEAERNEKNSLVIMAILIPLIVTNSLGNILDQATRLS